MSSVKKIILKIIGRILKLTLPKRSVYRIFTGEFFSNRFLLHLSFKQLYWAYFHGFLPKDYIVYNLSQNDPDLYLGQLSNIRKSSINGEFRHILGNKILFERHIKSAIKGIAHLNVIENLAYIEHGQLRSLNDSIVPDNFLSLLDSLLKNDLILKPVKGSKGTGIMSIERRNNHFFLNDGIKTPEELIHLFRSLDNYLIQKKFVQHGLSRNINPGTLNTIRICTMIDPENNEPFIAYAIHRFGSHVSGKTDNFTNGGISSRILDDGTLSIGKAINNDGKIEIFEKHPLSNEQIHGTKIKNWENIKKGIIEMVRRMPYFKHVGWDFILSEDEMYILEGNIGPGVNLVQIHTPLSDIKPAWKFLKYYKLVN